MNGVINGNQFSCELSYNSKTKIAITNGTLIKSCLKNEEKNLIYIWSPNCTSDACISLDLLQNYCNKQNYNLYVVAEYYDRAKMDMVYTLKNPVIGIDVRFYKSNFTSIYLNKFLTDLGYQKGAQLTPRYLYFDYDKLVYQADTLL